MKIANYRDLEVWNKSFNSGVKLYRILKDFPKFEQFSLCDQMRRCIISVTSNIAEGNARSSSKEYLHFLSISRGSVAELQTQILYAIELGYIEKNLGESFIYEYRGIDYKLMNLMHSIQKKSNPLNTIKTFFFSLL